MQLQTVRSVRFHQADGHKSRRNHLRNDRRNGNTRHAEMEHNDEEQIQNDVYNARNGQKVQRALCVAHRAQNRRAEVVQHHRRHAHKVYAHVKRRLTQNVLRGAHQGQQRLRKRNAHGNQYNTAHKACQHRGMYGLAQLLCILCAVIARHKHVCADGKADEHVDEQIDKRAGRAHRRQCRVAGKAADHHNIRRVKKQLQNAGKHQRHRKAQNFAQQRTVAHVDLVGPLSFCLSFRHKSLYLFFHISNRPPHR